jgi:hypothetical protein
MHKGVHSVVVAEVCPVLGFLVELATDAIHGREGQ